MYQKGRNASYLREINRKNILNIIRSQRVSRADLSRATGLTRPAVSAIVEQLISDGFVMESGVEETNRGRYPEILSLRPRSHFTVGVDISRDKCLYGITDITGEVLSSASRPIDDTPPTITVLSICDEIRAMLEAESIDKESVLGVGLSLPGPVDIENGAIINPPDFKPWHHFNIALQFEKALGLPAYAENHATAYALAEKLYGKGGDFANYFVLVLVDGVGSAGIINGVPYRGLHGFNSEFGHVSIDINGPACHCGNRGCLELYTSLPMLVRQVQEAGIAVRDWEDIVNLALTGNIHCLNVIKNQAKYLSFAINNIINSFFPEAIFLSGLIQYKPDLLLNLIKNDTTCKSFASDFSVPQILISHLVPNAQIPAAASIIINQLMS